jgi:uncharacterized protein YbgA (DUF1722 family)
VTRSGTDAADLFLRPTLTFAAGHVDSDPSHARPGGDEVAATLTRHVTLLHTSTEQLTDTEPLALPDGILVQDAGARDRLPLRVAAACAIESLGGLTNCARRRTFLTLLFALARLRGVQATREHARLVTFHARYKYLLMAHGAEHVRTLGRIAAARLSGRWDQALSDYRAGLVQALRTPGGRGARSNALAHVFGYVSSGLDAVTRAWWLDELERFRVGAGGGTAVTEALHRIIVAADGSAYLREQALFAPWPQDLDEVLSGLAG